MSDVKIVEVGPRDGLQNEPFILSLEDKLRFVCDLVRARAQTIEVGSFVRRDRIPQMANSEELYRALLPQLKKNPALDFPCLVPNLKGLEKALNAQVRSVAFFVSTSETFNKKNINSTIKESMIQLQAMAQRALPHLKVRAYLSTVFGCPYEGETSWDLLYRLCEECLQLGAKEVSLGDTIGVAHPRQVAALSENLKKRFGLSSLAFHFHDTRGRALANIYEAYQQGFRIFDSSAGGLGGCPYALGATGNVATEDVVDFFSSMGVETGIDLELVVKASERIFRLLGRQSLSKVHQMVVKRGAK